MSPPPKRPTAGQSSLEYVGLLTLVAAALAAAGPVVGLPGVGASVTDAVRTGICIVGGDVCRASDARAAGLLPCMVSDERKGGGGALTVGAVRVGSRGEVLVATRSDGSVTVVRSDSGELAASGGLGFELGPLHVGADGHAGAKVVDATGWEFPDAAAAKEFLTTFAAFRDTRRFPPAWRSMEGGPELDGSSGLGVQLGRDDTVGTPVGGIETSVEAALGSRSGRGRTTLYFRAATGGLHLGEALGHGLEAGARGPAVLEYTRDRGGPRELAFRLTAPGAEGHVVETVARMDLRVPANLAAARRLLSVRAPWPPALADDLRAVIRHTAAVGTIERSVYAVDDRSRDFEVAARLGAELGLELGRTKVNRRLVSASAWTAGSHERSREDCMA